MILFHGSAVEVRAPRLLTPNRALDFGPGFYTTLSRGQAEAVARKARLRKGGEAVVNVYSIDEEVAFAACDLLRFDVPDGAWLDFVSANREGENWAKGRDFVLAPLLTMMSIGHWPFTEKANCYGTRR